MAALPVTIIAASAVPSMVPATPKREVIVAAPADATPAEIMALPLTIGAVFSGDVSLLMAV